MNNLRAKKVRQTFTLPESVFQRFASVVPEGKRSALVAELLEQEALRRENAMVEACRLANQDAELAALESDFQNLGDTVTEAFDGNDW